MAGQMQIKQYKNLAPIPFNCLDQCFPTFFGSRHPYLALKILAAPTTGLIGIKIKELEFLAAPLAPGHGNLVCRGTPVWNH